MYIVEKYNLFVFTTETGRKTSVSFSCLFCSNKEYVSFIDNVLTLYISCNVKKSKTTAKFLSASTG